MLAEDMRVLLTDHQSLLGAALARALARQHEVRTLAPGADPRDRATAASAVTGCETIVHQVPLAAGAPEELLDAAARGTYNLLVAGTSVRRFILLSSLRIFEQYPADWWVTEHWAPRPTPTAPDLAPYLAELIVREGARVLPLQAITLRLGVVVDETTIAAAAPDPRWLHVDDAVQAVTRALAFAPPASGPQTGWWVLHIPGGGSRTRFPLELAGQEPFSYAPRHDLAAQVPLPLAARPTPRDLPQRAWSRAAPSARQRVVIFGAGGPIGASAAAVLAPDHTLRLTDARPLADIVAANRPFAPGAPLPRLLDAPHETAVVDVADYAEVRAAVHGQEAIVNFAVVRNDPVASFRVNLLGAYHVLRAAVAEGIRRVVHTGPRQLIPHAAGYRADFDLVDDVPTRPGVSLYFVTKLLAQEVCRIFATTYDLEVPALLFSRLVNPDLPLPRPQGDYQMLISWQDAGAAVRQAVTVPAFPHPFEILQITADVPNGRFRNDKAKHLLGWQPRDQLKSRWQRRFS
jgi:nucleoside-diphosphate-sugar epimerase